MLSATLRFDTLSDQLADGYSRPVRDEMLVENVGRMAAAVPLGTGCDTASPPHLVPYGTEEQRGLAFSTNISSLTGRFYDEDSYRISKIKKLDMEYTNKARIFAPLNSQYKMMVSVENMTVEYRNSGVDSEWDAFAGETNGDIRQTSLWGEYEFFSKGWTVCRFVVKKENNIIAGCQISIITIRFLGRIGYIQMGPCMKEKSPDTIGFIIDELKNFARKNKLLYLIIAPNYPETDIVQHLESNNFVVKKAVLPPTPKLEATLLLNLTLTEDELLKQMKKGRKQNIRKGLEMPVEFKKGEREDLETCFNLLEATAKRYNSYPEINTLDRLYKLWDLMRPHEWIDLHLGIVDGETVCCTISYAFGNTFQCSYWGWNGKYANYNISDVFDWCLIRYAKEKGYKYYDLVQLNLECANAISSNDDVPDAIKQKHFYGPTLYKMRFGGSVVTYPKIYAYYVNRLKYFFIHKVAGFMIEHLNTGFIVGFFYRLSRKRKHSV
ncbi:MAG: peptidoglycan bridge formation glycyltransferase FemA/FemB family protein [Cytophagaceae bacterium]|jgi:lipid II:glycine glycyltransferase (peptidoglycan interpeptide bridge formation enzyme)|nr:peptidoglycan bridge formation glycyltransferase FemA/FemB family protein [Cytophagaceae bacterium]